MTPHTSPPRHLDSGAAGLRQQPCGGTGGQFETTEKVGKVKKKTGQHGIIEASNTRGCGDAEDQGKAVELL